MNITKIKILIFISLFKITFQNFENCKNFEKKFSKYECIEENGFVGKIEVFIV